MTQYVLWMLICFLITLVVVLAASKRLTIIPTNKFTNMVEYGYEFVKKDMGESAIGHGYKKHLPFLATLFFFILVNNVVGIIPGMKPGSGTISTTAALALVAFIYFIACGVKVHGPIGYIKSLAPSGVAFPLNVLIWVIEVISTLLRPITLAVRLFCNMFAGHIVMGSFAIMVTLFAQPLLAQATAANVVGALPSLAFGAILLVIYGIEMFVGVIQAYVFTVLTAVYIQGAEAEGH